MKILKFIFLYSLMVLSFDSYAQKNDIVTDQLEIEIQKKKTLQILDSIKYCSLITIDSNEIPKVRIMYPFPVDSTFTVWLGTHSKSRKVNEIINNPRATLSYFNASTDEYVSIYGNAKIINTRAKKERYWRTAWKDYYPNRDQDYVLIKVTPNFIEALSYDKGLVSDEITAKPMTIHFN